MSIEVSTHSRLKAAAPSFRRVNTLSCFNTQPPEGGWSDFEAVFFQKLLFQHTAA